MNRVLHNGQQLAKGYYTLSTRSPQRSFQLMSLVKLGFRQFSCRSVVRAKLNKGADSLRVGPPTKALAVAFPKKAEIGSVEKLQPLVNGAEKMRQMLEDHDRAMVEKLLDPKLPISVLKKQQNLIYKDNFLPKNKVETVEQLRHRLLYRPRSFTTPSVSRLIENFSKSAVATMTSSEMQDFDCLLQSYSDSDIYRWFILKQQKVPPSIASQSVVQKLFAFIQSQSGRSHGPASNGDGSLVEEDPNNTSRK